MREMDHGTLNGHAAGIILKELVRRAITVIRNERQVFEVQHKAGYEEQMMDVFTSADSKAQEIYVSSLRECFPDYGIVAEEDALSVPPRNGAGYFTIDPMDGTRAFIRRQSHGVGTMIALVEGGRIVSAYIGDINTQEIYGFRPGSERVHRITAFETGEQLTLHARPLAKQYVLLRDPAETYSEAAQDAIHRFKSFEIEGGSIGTWLARIWKREVGAALIPPAHETPWDATPIIGITEKLGYLFCRTDEKSGKWVAYEPQVSAKTYRRDHDLLVVHPDTLKELNSL